MQRWRNAPPHCPRKLQMRHGRDPRRSVDLAGMNCPPGPSTRERAVPIANCVDRRTSATRVTGVSRLERLGPPRLARVGKMAPKRAAAGDAWGGVINTSFMETPESILTGRSARRAECPKTPSRRLGGIKTGVRG